MGLLTRLAEEEADRAGECGDACRSWIRRGHSPMSEELAMDAAHYGRNVQALRDVILDRDISFAIAEVQAAKGMDSAES